MRKRGLLPPPRVASHPFTWLARERDTDDRLIHEPVKAVHRTRQAAVNPRPERQAQDDADAGHPLQHLHGGEHVVLVAPLDAQESDETGETHEQSNAFDTHVSSLSTWPHCLYLHV